MPDPPVPVGRREEDAAEVIAEALERKTNDFGPAYATHVAVILADALLVVGDGGPVVIDTDRRVRALGLSENDRRAVEEARAYRSRGWQLGATGDNLLAIIDRLVPAPSPAGEGGPDA